MYIVVVDALLFLVLFRGRGHHCEDRVHDNGEDMAEKVKGFPGGKRAIQRQENKGRHHVLGQDRSGDHTGDSIQRPLLAGEIWRDLFLGQAFAKGEKRHRQEEQVIARVDCRGGNALRVSPFVDSNILNGSTGEIRLTSMPKSTHRVHSQQTSACSNIYIFCQPKRRLLVPFLGQTL